MDWWINPTRNNPFTFQAEMLTEDELEIAVRLLERLTGCPRSDPRLSGKAMESLLTGASAKEFLDMRPGKRLEDTPLEGITAERLCIQILDLNRTTFRQLRLHLMNYSDVKNLSELSKKAVETAENFRAPDGEWLLCLTGAFLLMEAVTDSVAKTRAAITGSTAWKGNFNPYDSKMVRDLEGPKHDQMLASIMTELPLLESKGYLKKSFDGWRWTGKRARKKDFMAVKGQDAWQFLLDAKKIFWRGHPRPAKQALYKALMGENQAKPKKDKKKRKRKRPR
jgi:hypothetical protein